MAKAVERSVERIVGRYALYGEIASGGMATVHFGRLLGPVGFSRTVAIKRLHPQFAKDPEFVSMFLDEARLAGRIQHPNAVATLDVVALEGELFLVMEYVQGEALARIFRAHRASKAAIPVPIVCSVMTGVLYGLHAAHEAKTERGEPLGIVHRDVSPQNIMVGIDGTPRVLDFGVAKAAGRVQTTREGQIKGKLAYMAPEQMRGGSMDRRVDVYGAAVVLWEALVGRQLFAGDNEGMVFAKVIEGASEPPSKYRRELSPEVDAVVMRGLSREPADRFATARDMAVALEEVLGLASPRQVGEWVERVAGDSLAKRAERVKEIESISTDVVVPAGLGFPGQPGGMPLPAGADPEGNAPTTISDVSRKLPALPPVGAEPVSGPHVPISQVSSISVSRPPTMPPDRRSANRKLAAIVATVVASVAFGGLGAVLLGARGSSPGAGADVAPPPATASSSPPPVIPVVASIEPRATASAAPPDPTSAPSGAPPAVAVVKPGPGARPAKPPPTPAKPPDKAPQTSCNPPYTVDASGIRRPKPQCM